MDFLLKEGRRPKGHSRGRNIFYFFVCNHWQSLKMLKPNKPAITIEADIDRQRLKWVGSGEGWRVCSFFWYDILLYKWKHTVNHLFTVRVITNHILGSTTFNIFVILKIIILEWGPDNEAKWHQVRSQFAPWKGGWELIKWKAGGS